MVYQLFEEKPDYAVKCQGVTKSFVKREGREKPFWKLGSRGEKNKFYAVKDINFTINKGEIFGVLGPNGSGKSTLIRMIATLLLPDSGQVHVFGYDVTRDQLKVRKFINRVSVDAAFFKKLSAHENLSYAARLYGIPGKVWKKKALDIFDRLSLERDKIFSPMEELSRGMQQKVSIARALLTSPVLLLLDEPTTGLDPKSKKDVQDFVLQVQREHDATILLTTHDMTEAERLCDRIAIINRGKIVAIDTAEGLKKKVRLKKGIADPSLEDVFFILTGREWEEEE